MAVAAALGCAEGSVLKQKLKLMQGWNATYLEVTPKNGDPAAVFGAAGVERAGCHFADAYGETAQYNAAGERVKGMARTFASWDAGMPQAATLKRVVGGCVYMVFAKAAGEVEVLGVPVQPRTAWRSTAGEDAMMNLVGVSVDEGAEVTAKDYFGAGPFGQKGQAWGAIGRNEGGADWYKLGAKAKLGNGSAVAATAERSGEWGGVLKATFDSDARGVMAFGAGMKESLLRVENQAGEALRVKVTHRGSDDAGQAAAGLKYKTGGAWKSLAVGESFEAEVEAGGRLEATVAPDLGALPGGAGEIGSLLRIEAVGHASKMRVFAPVELNRVEMEAKKANFPKGLWVGKMDMQQVAQISQKGNADSLGKEPEKAGGRVTANLLVLVGEDGKARMLQRVAVGAEEGEGGAVRTRLFLNPEDAPKGMRARRVSSVLADPENPVVEAKAGGTFGEELTFEFTVGEHSKSNPFRHPWHPDHDGLDAKFMERAPSGDVPENYRNPVKPELFSVGNRVRLKWETAEGYRFGWTPEETTVGVVEWEIDGLVKDRTADRTLRVRGVFMLKRALETATIE